MEPQTTSGNGKPYIGTTVECLNGGFVRLVDYMGSDAAIVQAARVSYGEGTKQVRQDRALIRYLMRHWHTSPFEMVEFKFHVKLPIFVARQWIRHRTANVNEYSGRYSILREEFYLPEPEQVRFQSRTNKQGRAEQALPPEEVAAIIDTLAEQQRQLYEWYQQLLAKGVARELARINLPVSLYTEWYWKIDLHNLFHFLQLRMDPHAQYEIRVYAQAIASIIKNIVPMAWEAFEDYRLNARAFSANELKLLAQWLPDPELLTEEIAAAANLSKRELRELRDKIAFAKTLQTQPSDSDE